LERVAGVCRALGTAHERQRECKTGEAFARHARELGGRCSLLPPGNARADEAEGGALRVARMQAVFAAGNLVRAVEYLASALRRPSPEGSSNLRS
jgi:hypothetical protein